MAMIIYIQRTDTTYDSVNFDDPISTLSYFKKVYQPFSQTSDEEVDKHFEPMMSYFERTTKRGSELSAEVQAHQIMRSAAEKIHATFQELDRDMYGIRVMTVTGVISEAHHSLVRLMHRCIVDEHKHLQTLSEQLIRDHNKDA